jgi:hypothetical protein
MYKIKKMVINKLEWFRKKIKGLATLTTTVDNIENKSYFF